MDNNIYLRIKAFIVFFYLCLQVNAAPGDKQSPENDLFNQNIIYKKSIHTVQFFKKGWEFSHPVLQLNSDQQLLLKFDDLTEEAKDYIYTITHCDYNWNPSNLIKNEYMEGYPENPLDDYEYSFNTTTSYVNHHLSIPNDNVTIKLSGNYLLKIWDGQDREKPVLVRRFYVVEDGVSINGRVKKATFDGFHAINQEVDFNINYSNFHIPSPMTDVKVVVMQNFRTDNAITNLRPLFIHNNVLEYNYNQQNVFPGGNEFRNFDTKDLKIAGRGVYSIKYFEPLFHVTLLPDKIEAIVRHRTDEDLNGRYLAKRDRAEDSDIEADYIFAHFSLQTETPLAGRDLYVFGELTDWQCTPGNRMTYSLGEKMYIASILLKQGFYDYQYVYVKKDSKKIDTYITEGSHFETENEYQIFVYFSGMVDRYDRLIGFHKLNPIKR